MKLIKKLTAAAFIIICTASVFLYLNSPPSLMRSEVFFVSNGEALVNVSRRLREQNLIESELFFSSLGKIIHYAPVKPGKYRIKAGSSSIEIFWMLIRGDILRRRVTIPEGYNLYQIAERLEQNEIVKKDIFLRSAFDRAFLKSIGINAPSAEGYLFPDTYIFPEESNARSVIQTMLGRLKYVLNQVDLSNMNRLNLTTHTLLVMASLIEKEARKSFERIYVSAVFHNRMKRGMKLDCDPTVRYAVKRFTGPIYYRDLQSTSPYNTYRQYGYPPTPICSPGRASIVAALNPKKTDFLFFVARNDGSHYFSRTNREHTRAVQFYQRGKQNGFVDNQRL
ncbi:MAG TPA: endolytic transglycosylase MltG [Spirochaetota bacterium]|nr:endolytic transglycosylase MltG [Spirochaetota bacterium]HPJ37352.1 endolytic transglycosylase MltG [Spirochaetota bacterium]HPQ53700.1 endolytic transglycosylase MltG [Spirochaetota bacterium]